jgi:hypothetical protein
MSSDIASERAKLNGQDLHDLQLMQVAIDAIDEQPESKHVTPLRSC